MRSKLSPAQRARKTSRIPVLAPPRARRLSRACGETRSDGKLRVWLTNVSDRGRAVLTHSYDNVKRRTAKHPGGFSERHWNPIWGGKGPVRKTREDRLLVDHVYIAGAGRP